MKRWKSLAAVTVVIAAASFAACGGSSTGPSPVSPTAADAPSTPAAVTGATIAGTVQGPVSGSSVGARDVITVTIVGTNLSATVDAQGNFVITGVPAGTVTLAFTGTAATVTLQNVGASGQVKLKITITAGNATVETEQRVLNGQAELEGRISALGATAGTFYVDTILVTATGATIRHGDTTVPPSALKVGDRVHVTGTSTGAEAMTATEVIVQNTNANVPVNLKGAISNPVVTGCPAAAEFVVEGWKVRTVGNTDFRKGACADLKTGVEVHVKGDVIAATTTVPAYVQATWVQFGK